MAYSRTGLWYACQASLSGECLLDVTGYASKSGVAGKILSYQARGIRHLEDSVRGRKWRGLCEPRRKVVVMSPTSTAAHKLHVVGNANLTFECQEIFKPPLGWGMLEPRGLSRRAISLIRFSKVSINREAEITRLESVVVLVPTRLVRPESELLRWPRARASWWTANAANAHGEAATLTSRTGLPASINESDDSA